MRWRRRAAESCRCPQVHGHVLAAEYAKVFDLPLLPSVRRVN
jgi:hypothetical protein